LNKYDLDLGKIKSCILKSIRSFKVSVHLHEKLRHFIWPKILLRFKVRVRVRVRVWVRVRIWVRVGVSVCFRSNVFSSKCSRSIFYGYGQIQENIPRRMPWWHAKAVCSNL